jgi:DNA repair exonuclease SbcCD ATPase subunit
LDKQQIAEKLKHQTNQDSQIACKEMEKKLYHLEEEIKKKEILNSILEKDGLPLYLLNKKMRIMECQMNDLLSPFLPGKQIRFFIEQKSIEFGVISSSNSNTMVNLFGGMESFILELVIKLTFSKYSILPRSNFFIIDEGISVLDQQNISNINSLFQFLSHLVTNVLLISHIPQIQDFVDKSMYITKTNNKSNVVFGKK